ncbi:DUF3253 domain-containing protein [Pirellulaceae bacterium SH449]
MGKTRWLDHEEPGPDDVKNEILRLLMCLKSGESICPSDAARAFGSKWRQYMPLVRDVVSDMFRDDLIDVTQQGTVIDLEERSIESIKGPIRVQLRKPNLSNESM